MHPHSLTRWFCFAFVLASALVSNPSTAVPPRAWTVMVYTATANNLESYAFRDLAKLTASAPAQRPVAATMLIATEHYGDWSIAVEGDPRAKDGVVMTRIAPPAMSDRATLADFIRDSAARFPAEHYALILQSHGSGWFQTMAPEKTVAVGQIAASIGDAGVPIEILGFDMCLMATIETAYELRDRARYVLASEDYGPWEGVIGPELLATFSAGPDPLAILRGLSASFIARNDQAAADDPADISILDLSAVKPLTAFLQTHLPQGPLDASYFSVTNAVDQTTEPPWWQAQDLTEVARRLLSDQPAALDEFQALFDRVVVGYWQDIKKRSTDYAPRHHGLSIVVNGEQDTSDTQHHYRELSFPIRLVTTPERAP